MRRRFDELVFHSSEFEARLNAYFVDLDRTVHDRIREELLREKSDKLTAKNIDKIINQAIQKSTLFPDVTKLFIVRNDCPHFRLVLFRA